MLGIAGYAENNVGMPALFPVRAQKLTTTVNVKVQDGGEGT